MQSFLHNYFPYASDAANQEYLAAGIDDGSADVAVWAHHDASHTAYVDDTSNTTAVGNPDVIVEHTPYVASPDLIEDSFTDWSDWSWAQAPPIDDFPEDFILGAGQGLDDQDWTDAADYGAQTDPLSSDNNPEFIPSSDGSGLDAQDFTDTADYGDRIDPLSTDFPEDHLLGDGQGLDSQDFTDFADYGFVQDAGFEQDAQLGGDGDGLDDQDFTDFAHYGSNVDPLSNDAAAPVEDFLLGDSESEQDYSDLEPYGFEQVAGEEQDQQLGDGLGLDDQDATDFADYGAAVAPLADDFPEDFVLGVSEPEQDYTDHEPYGFEQSAGFEQDDELGNEASLDDQDWTDHADYGTQVDPLSADFPQNQLLGQHEPEADYTDFADYGFSVAPLSADAAAQDFAHATISEPEFDWTDFADYGTQSDPQIADVFDPPLGVSEDEPDRTDYTDYGSQSEAGEEQDQQLGTGDGLDDQDFTDRADYGSTVEIAGEEQDFVLGVSEREQDHTDFADYGFAQDAVTEPVDDAPQGVINDASEYADPSFTDHADYGFVYWPVSDLVFATGEPSGTWKAPTRGAWVAPVAARVWSVPVREAWRVVAARVWKAIKLEGWRS